MYIRRFFSLLLVLALLVSGAALAEQSDPEARIAELEAQVEELTQKLEEAEALIRDYEEKSYVVTFDGGVVTVEEAQAQYDYVASMYQSYGYSIAGYEDYIRKDLVDMLAERAVVNFKAEELGYADLDEETMAAYEQEAAATHEFDETVTFETVELKTAAEYLSAPQCPAAALELGLNVTFESEFPGREREREDAFKFVPLT